MAAAGMFGGTHTAIMGKRLIEQRIAEDSMLALHVLASGSAGNAAVVENTTTSAGVLIDCGICKRDFLTRCDEARFDPARIEAVLVTHENGDHVKGLGVVLRGLAKLGCTPPVFAAGACVANSNALAKAAEAFDVRELATSVIEAAGLRTIPFPTSHDAAASFGFRIEDAADGDALGYLTDSGVVTPKAHAALRDVRILALVKQRIASDAGHLSNGQAAAELAALIAESRAADLRVPQTVVAMHISQNNNEYSLARRTLASALAEVDCPAEAVCGYQERLTSVR